MDDQLTGKLRELFAIPQTAFPKLRYKLHELNKKIIEKKGKFPVYDDIHQIAIDIFHTEYFPVISHNIKIDENNMAIIMGGIAYNMNMPNKMAFLKLKTDDIDIKIYSTVISHLHKDKQATAKVLSVFKFTVLIICMFLKQFFKYISTFQVKTELPHKQISTNAKKQSKKARTKKAITKNASQIKKVTTKKIKQHHKGGASIIKEKPKSRQLLEEYELKLQIKKKLDNDKIYTVVDTLNLTEITYAQLYSKIIENINDIHFLVTNKISYETDKPNKMRAITFCDVAIIYPSIEYPAFFAQYLLEKPIDMHKSLDKLINMRIPVSKIMDVKACPLSRGVSENCRFMSVKSLIIDMIVMLSYVDLLAYEKLESGGQVLVPSGFIFKYYKYLAKLVRLITIRKYYSGTLNNQFFESAKAFWEYALTDLRKKSSQLRAGLDEYDPINLTYKRFLNEFHQNLFHNRSIFIKKYPFLMEIAEEYSQLAYYVNKSRALFQKLNESSTTLGSTIESVAIKYAQEEISKLEAESKSRSSAGHNAISKLDSKSDSKSDSKPNSKINKRTDKTIKHNHDIKTKTKKQKQ